jgi:hypothetical protein
MAGLNALDCGSDVRNTGIGGCSLNFEATKGDFLVPKGRVYTQAELATPASLRAALEADILAPKGTRIFPLHGFEAITDNTEDPTFQTMASGRQVPIREGNYNWIFQYYDGGLCLSNKLRSFKNNTGYAVLFYDAENKLFGTTKTASDGKPGMAGIPLEVLYPFPWKPNDFANAPIYRIQFSFKPNYINEDIAYVDAGFNLDELNGLQNINLTVVGTPAGGVFQVQALTGCDKSNLYDLYSTQLASAALWTLANAATGAAIPITSVAANATLKAFTVTADTADPAYTAVGATGKVSIGTVGPAALDAADIAGYESIPVEVVRGA